MFWFWCQSLRIDQQRPPLNSLLCTKCSAIFQRKSIKEAEIPISPVIIASTDQNAMQPQVMLQMRRCESCFFSTGKTLTFWLCCLCSLNMHCIRTCCLCHIIITINTTFLLRKIIKVLYLPKKLRKFASSA